MNRLILLIIALLFFLFSVTSTHSATFKQAQYIYNQILIANKLPNPPPLKLSNMPMENAWSNGFTVTITNKALKAWSNDEIAFVLGHELAHHYVYRTPAHWFNEYGADRMGEEMAKRTKYNICRGVYQFFHRYNSEGSDTHPPDTDRYRRTKC